MQYICYDESPLGSIMLAAKDEALIGLWFEGQKFFAANFHGPAREGSTPVFAQTRRWLEAYFDGQSPETLPSLPPLAPQGTPFQKSVWEILRTIPYGQTVTYGDIATRIAAQRGLKSMSAQAVGQAVAKNPISILIPCHRVVGKGGSLTGYAAGIDKKLALLTLEGVGVAQFSLPKGGSAL